MKAVNKSSAIAVSITSVILLVTPVLAQDSANTASVRPLPPQKIETRKIAIDNKFASREANLQDRIAKEKQAMEDRRTLETSKVALFRQKLENKRVLIASEEAKFREKLQTFKDKQKVTVADRVNTNLNKINQNQTDQMLKNLDLMSALLDKLTDRVNQGSPGSTPDIKDPTGALQAISDAREVIDTARSAVQTQAQKDYTITVTTETKIRLDAQTKRDQLHTDITDVRKLVIDAKQAVSNAVRIAKGMPKEATPSSDLKEGTASGQQ